MKFGKSKTQKINTNTPKYDKYAEIENHHVMIAYAYNAQMKQYDLLLQIGNFKTEKEVRSASEEMRLFVEEFLRFKMHKPQ